MSLLQALEKKLNCGMIILENEYLRASVASLGAELRSLINKEASIEHMWNGDPAFWPKFSPVLFPVVGLLKDETYYYKDKPYQLPRHGFAREKEFAAEQVSETEALFTLAADELTLAMYPFPFILKLRYRLDGRSLSCTYEVENPGTDELLFSVGAHPAFAVPFVNGTTYSDYQLTFNKHEQLLRWKLANSHLDGTTVPLPTPGDTLPLTHQLFYEDAIVLKNLQSNRISITSPKTDRGIHFDFNNFPYFGIWAAKDAPFVCLEPWCGVADSTNHNQQLEHKEGIERLPPAGKLERTWSVTCF